MSTTRTVHDTIMHNGEPIPDFTVVFTVLSREDRTPQYNETSHFPRQQTTVTTDANGDYSVELVPGLRYEVSFPDAFTERGSTVQYHGQVFTIVVPAGSADISMSEVRGQAGEPIDPALTDIVMDNIGPVIDDRIDEATGDLQNDINSRALQSDLDTHTNDTDNPHGVTAAQTGAYTTGQIDTLLNAKADTASLGTAAMADTGDFATAAQGSKADTAVQPGDLGTAAAEDVGAFATAAQGAKADTALQAADIANFETSTQLDARDTANRDRANHTGTQAISTVSGLQDALNERVESSALDGLIEANTDVAANTAARHDHANKTLLDDVTPELLVPGGGVRGQVLTVGVSGRKWEHVSPLPSRHVGGGLATWNRATAWWHSGTHGLGAITLGTHQALSNWRAAPVYIDATMLITDMAIEVTATGTAETARLGIFTLGGTEDNTATLVHDVGVVDASSTGVKAVTSVGFEAPPGWYWFAIDGDGTGTVRTIASGKSLFYFQFTNRLTLGMASQSKAAALTTTVGNPITYQDTWVPFIMFKGQYL